LRLLETAIRPRETRWMSWPSARMGNALLMICMAFLLALPLPPIPPFTNAFPSYAIILLAASMMEEDGVLIWAGYFVSIATTVYFIIWAEVIATQLHKWMHNLMLFWQHLSA
jgi:hypothetical protein